MNFLNELNKEQRQAVEHLNGQSLVIAGAGSGKTRVLTYKIAYLLSQGVQAYNILALTFTNKAAKEMKERIIKLVGYQSARNLWMGTFHSRFAAILRNEAERIKYPRNFTIYDTADSKNAIKKIVTDLSLDKKIYNPSEILGRISAAKNNLLTASDYANNRQIREQDKINHKYRMADIFRIYTERCFKAGAMDFDDLLLKTIILFKNNPDVLKKYQDVFRYILVDEYQDTNYAQYLIVKNLARKHQNVCVVGDDAQSIYAFRGAKIENILNFKVEYPDYKLFKLEQNYRSTQNIVKAANSVISKNQSQIKKNVWSKNENGSKIKVYCTYSDTEEGEVICNDLFDKKHTSKFDFKDFAILYRTNAQSRIFEESLRKKNIPYKIYGGLSFYQRKEIKDLIAYFRLVVNHFDEEAFRRIINYPARGIGKTTVDRIIDYSNKNVLSIWDIITNFDKHEIGIQNAAKTKVSSFVEMIKSFAKSVKEMNAFDAAYTIAQESKMISEFFNDRSPENISRYDNIEALLNGIREFSENPETENENNNLAGFLENVALLTDADNEKPEDFNKVSLMTVHSAKGLEFDNVFVVGLEEELFPSLMSMDTKDDIEEERRLFYVAITRARKNAVISYSKSRFKWGQLKHTSPSRFIDEIDTEYVELPEDFNEFSDFENDDFGFASSFSTRKFNNTNKPQTNKTSSFTSRNLRSLSKNQSGENKNQSSEYKLQVGSSVEHARFGKGKVLLIEGSPPNEKATIFFNSSGQKQLLLKFAKLKVL